MKLGETLAKLDRLQQGKRFKIVASVLVVIAAIGYVSWYAVEAATAARQIERFELPAEVADAELTEAEQETLATVERLYGGLNKLRLRQEDWTSIALATTVVTAMALAVIWLGLGLTGIALLVLLFGVVAPIWFVGWALPSTVKMSGVLRGGAAFAAAAGMLTFAFMVLMQLLRIAFSGSTRTLAIARNIVNEAVRMKISLVFIVLLIFALAALPGLLNDDTPLRYRVQSFLQYGAGGTFWITAILTLFLSVGSVTLDQRDRMIWQTVTKPVSAWEYLFGKWLGVVGVAAVLLAVSGTGVFLFTEYLRNQPAIGERAAFESAQPIDSMLGWTEDRVILETQVLTARDTVAAELPAADPRAVEQELDRRMEVARASDPLFEDTWDYRRQLEMDFAMELREFYFSVPYNGGIQEYTFRGLKRARETGTPALLRYKVNVGGNDPRERYTVGFYFENAPAYYRTVPVGQMMSETIPPLAIRADGTLRIGIENRGSAVNGPEQSFFFTFPPEGLVVTYEVGSYRVNYARVMFVLWLKLGFLAMLGVSMSTFLSFSVSSLVSFGTFFIAESAGYLLTSLEYYRGVDQQGNTIWYKAIVRVIAVPIANAFSFYAELKPTSSLVEGRVLSWAIVGTSIVILGALTGFLYLIGVISFKRRELAIYSGH